MKRPIRVLLLVLFAAVIALATAACGDTGGEEENPQSGTEYTVTFNSNGGSAVAAVKVRDGKKIAEPAAPTKAGYTFEGWYKEIGLNNLWDFSSDTVTRNITLYANWTPIVYTVTFNSKGGSTVAAVNIAHGERITEPTAPEKTGYAFSGWYKESGLNNLWDFSSDTVTGNITLYAKWEELPGTEGLKYALNSGNDSYSVTGYTGNTKDIIIPATYNGLPVTSIADNAFYGKSITLVFIPSGVTSIGPMAFMYCETLSNVAFGAGSKLESISLGAFAYCRSLVSIEIPAGVTSIGLGAFSHCSSLESIEIQEGVTSIGESAFSHCSSLESIEIPEGVTSIGYGAFWSCDSLASIEIPASVTSIGNGAFYDCASLASIEIPVGVTSIGYQAFAFCDSLASIEIPAGVTSIGYQAFAFCDSLASIEIPEGVTSIGYSAFGSCDSLVIYARAASQPGGWASDWNISSRPVYWGINESNYYKDEQGVQYVIEGGSAILTRAPISAESVTIASSITIGSSVYSVTGIGGYAFYSCDRLGSVTMNRVTPPSLGSYAFDYTPSDMKIYVPSGSEDTYKSASRWSSYASKITVKP